MQAGYDSLVENQNWKITPLPENWQIITGQWYLKLKKDHDGQGLKYKTRCVAHDFEQQEGIDFVKTFTKVVNLVF